ncbi:MAG: hypothetical protein ACI89X_002484 [Planctomycetota bacterium]|jgi:hypothetical protein
MTVSTLAPVLHLVLGLLVSSFAPVQLAAQGPITGAQPNREANEALAALTSADSDLADDVSRRAWFRTVLAEQGAWLKLEQAIDDKLDVLERGYAELLDESIRTAYHRRLRSLTDAEMHEVARVRRVWSNYILRPATQLHFQQHFLMPATNVGKLLLPDLVEIQTKASNKQLKRMHEFNGYRNEVREALGLGMDPTTGKKAPTGIPMPPLSKPRSYQEHLDHLHRTMSVASSVAPREANGILLRNAHKARKIDLEEAEFVLYSNEIRCLMGVLCWETDVLACAATRDHSKDRVDGNASGHWNDLPGKKGFTHRLRRFGTSGTSEGAGGGSNGRNYLHALSYGGGHTGPLYSMKRNKVGCGRFGNCYTSTYGRDKNIIHPCPASTGELFMPPGIGLADITDPSLQDVYHALAFDNYVGAKQLLAASKAKTKMDKFVRNYLTVAVEVEAAWQLECITHVAATGDLYTVSLMIERTRGKFGDSLDKRLRRYEKRLATRSGKQLVKVGQAYVAACEAKDHKAIGAIVKNYGDTVYARAATQHLEATKAGNQEHPLQWFLSVDKYLARFEYLSPN